MTDKPKVNAAAIKGLEAVISKHGKRLELDVLFDLAKALGLRVRVEFVECGGGDGT